MGGANGPRQDGAALLTYVERVSEQKGCFSVNGVTSTRRSVICRAKSRKREEEGGGNLIRESLLIRLMPRDTEECDFPRRREPRETGILEAWGARANDNSISRGGWQTTHRQRHRVCARDRNYSTTTTTTTPPASSRVIVATDLAYFTRCSI